VAHSLVRAEKSGSAQAAYNRRRAECEEALARVQARLEDGEPVLPGAEPITYRSLLQQMPVAELTAVAEDALHDPLQMRFRHVVTEATRVYEAERALRQEDLLTFGLLMDASHESLRSDYEVSSPELDLLVDLARSGGAAGARLTGAGFGGCIVALAGGNRVEDVLQSLGEGYFADRDVEGTLGEALFVAEPSPGAAVYAL
jgi:galactokinase